MSTASAAEERYVTQEFSVSYRVCDPTWRTRGLPRPVAEIAAFLERPRRLGEVIEKSQISAAKTRAVVRKLTAIGVVSRASGAGASDDGEKPRQTGPLHAFSSVEIAFFESEVQPIDECDEPFNSWGERVSRRLARMALRLR